MNIRHPREAFSEQELESDTLQLRFFKRGVVVPRGKLLDTVIEPVTDNKQPPEQLNDIEAIDLTTLE